MIDDLTLDFENPIELDGFDFNDEVERELESPVESSVEDIQDDVPVEDTPVESTDDSIDAGESFDSMDAPEIANYLSSISYLGDIPEGVNPDEYGQEELKKHLEFRDEQLKTQSYQSGAEYERKRIISKLPPILQQAMSYTLDVPNADDNDVLNYLDSLKQVSTLTSLDVEKDAEKIIREYYKSEGASSEFINGEIADLIERDKLKAKAELYKPRLDQKAQSIVQAKQEAVEELKQYEESLQSSLQERVLTPLKTGQINGVQITQEEAQFVYGAIMNNNVPVNIKGKQIDMGYLEALIMQEKYKGNIENVMMAALVLKEGPKAINKFFAKQAKNKEVEKIVKQTKFSNKRRTSVKGAKNTDTESLQLTF